MLFQDRTQAGRVLASKLTPFANRPDVVALALPRGSVSVAYEVARALNAPVDVLLVRKLGVPGYSELAMGAVASPGTRILNREVVRALGISKEELDAVTAAQLRDIERQAHLFRGDRPPPDVRKKTVILVDDSLAIGSTMRAAIDALKQQGPARIVVAVPVATPEACDELQSVVDEVVCTVTPQPFYAVGAWYRDFSQASHEEVRELLEQAAERQGGASVHEERSVEGYSRR